MVRTIAVLAVMSLGLSREPGCGGADSPSSGLNAPCTRSKDCSAGLVCDQGVCTDPDGGNAPLDGGRDAKSTVDASNDGG